MTNRLAGETSPYLLQHAENPVDWYPWGAEALHRAQQEQKPIFLSIGYSACHWCHVMERESFEDAEIASYLNDQFVCIKVDREERPDLEQIYMQAVQMLAGRGGWPMSVFLTPDLYPFFGGTYWPARSHSNLPGFDRVLAAVLDAWQNRREQAEAQAKQLTQRIAAGIGSDDQGSLSPSLLDQAAARLRQQFDFSHGGFGDAPKFPHPMNLQLLLRVGSRGGSQDRVDMVRLNLDKMSRGGIYDHLAGGFARYSVDQRWLVPHFEKMLYDNALLADAYLDGYLATRDQEYGRVVRDTLDYVLGYMTDETGGFHSTEDADSEGEEGKFYVWTPAEIREVLDDPIAARFCYVYDVTEEGNFEGKSLLNLPKTIEQCAEIKSWDAQQLVAEMAQARRQLLEVRDRRVRPAKDDKILVSWNGLMIHSMARGAAFKESKYIDAACRAANFILDTCRRNDGRLLHAWRQGRARFDAYLDDYACLANSLVSLYEATFFERWIDQAVLLAETLLRHFRDPHEGGFFFTADDHETLIARTKDIQDSSVPSGNAMAASALLRLGKLCGRQDFVAAAEETLQLAAGFMQQYPTAAGQMLVALDSYFGPTREIVILGDGAESQEVVEHLLRQYYPNRVLARRAQAAGAVDASPHLDALFAGKALKGSPPSLYVCENFSCQQPARGKEAAMMQLRDLL